MTLLTFNVIINIQAKLMYVNLRGLKESFCLVICIVLVKGEPTWEWFGLPPMPILTMRHRDD